MTLAHNADYSFTIYVRDLSMGPESGDSGYMSAYINWPSGGSRDLSDGLPTEETLEKIFENIRRIFLGEDKHIDA